MDRNLLEPIDDGLSMEKMIGMNDRMERWNKMVSAVWLSKS
jgi:hypothetical protein